MKPQFADGMSERTFTPQREARGLGCASECQNPAGTSGTIARLNEICRRLQAGQPLGEDLALWLSGSLRTFLEQQNKSLQDAFGLRFPRGGIPWWREEAMRERDAALRELAQTFLADMSTNAKAEHIHKAAKRYAATSWRFDKRCETVPQGYEGTPRAPMWVAFKSGAPMPLGVRQLRNILAEA